MMRTFLHEIGICFAYQVGTVVVNERPYSWIVSSKAVLESLKEILIVGSSMENVILVQQSFDLIQRPEPAKIYLAPPNRAGWAPLGYAAKGCENPKMADPTPTCSTPIKYVVLMQPKLEKPHSTQITQENLISFAWNRKHQTLPHT